MPGAYEETPFNRFRKRPNKRFPLYTVSRSALADSADIVHCITGSFAKFQPLISQQTDHTGDSYAAKTGWNLMSIMIAKFNHIRQHVYPISLLT